MIMKLPIRIYHDALMQRGGAEKIALTWIEKFQVPLFVLAANPDLISEYKVHIRTLIPWIKSQIILKSFLTLI